MEHRLEAAINYLIWVSRSAILCEIDPVILRKAIDYHLYVKRNYMYNAILHANLSCFADEEQEKAIEPLCIDPFADCFDYDADYYLANHRKWIISHPKEDMIILDASKEQEVCLRRAPNHRIALFGDPIKVEPLIIFSRPNEK